MSRPGRRRSTPRGRIARRSGLDTTGAVRDAVERGARRCSTRARRAWPSRTGRRLARQPVAEEGGAAVVPAQRQCASMAGRAASVRQGAARSSPAGTRRAFRAAGFRAVPGAVVRRGAFIGKGAVLMPSFVNIGAYVGEGTMVDTWATVGSRARRSARNVHLSGGAGIGGVLEPLQADPVIIEDGAFIGARVRGGRGRARRRGRGAVDGRLSRRLDQDRRPRDRRGVSRRGAALCGGRAGRAAGGADGGPALYCAVIVKRVDAQTRQQDRRSTSCCATEWPPCSRSFLTPAYLPFAIAFVGDDRDRADRGDRAGARPSRSRRRSRRAMRDGGRCSTGWGWAASCRS